MGDKILIYDNGNRYEIDSDLLYIPWFAGEKKKDKEENKNDTESISNTG